MIGCNKPVYWIRESDTGYYLVNFAENFVEKNYYDELIKKIEYSKLTKDSTLYFSKSSNFPRLKLENTGFKSAYIAKIETLISRREELLESLKEKHTKATPRLSDEELKDKKEAERTTAKHEAYEKAVEKYCNEVGYSRLDYQTHEFYADRGQREHLPPEKLNPNKK